MKLKDYFFKSPYWKFIKWLWIGAFAGIIILTIIISTIAMGKFGQLPPIEELENPRTYLASEVFADDNSLLGKYYFQNRSNANYQDLSPQLINALIATEDIRFYEHSGIDNKRLFTIILYNLMGRRQGGSTISQQLAKNLFPRKKFKGLLDKTITKIQEWITAVYIERRYTKDEILTMYFNTVDFGDNSFGIRSASKTFFGKTPKELNAKEAAVLVGVLKAPTTFNPIRKYENSINRRNTVLNQMAKGHFISEDSCRIYKTQPIELNYRQESHIEGLATYFRETLRIELLDWCEENGFNLYKDGLKIYTTINPVMQEIAEKVVQEQLKLQQKKFNAHWKGREPWGEFAEVLISGMKRSDRYHNAKKAGKSDQQIKTEFDTRVKMRVVSYAGGEIDTTMTPMDSIKYYKYFMQCGLMSMDPQSGKIKVWVGGHNYKYFQYDHVNITAKRQVGSTFKPFVYTVAVDNGFSPCTLIPNKPVSFEGYPDYNPGNADEEYTKPEMTMYSGLQHSTNLICLNVLKMLGEGAINNVIELTKKMGILSKVEPYPSSALGTADISVYEMVGAFSTFANKGVWIKPTYLTRIIDKNGNVIFDNAPVTQEALSEQTAYIMCKMLEKVTTHGTAAKVKYLYNIPGAVGGKTGTTQNFSDGWFIGITPSLVTGLWTGWEDRAIHYRTIELGAGGAMAMPIWAAYMQGVVAAPNQFKVINEWPMPQAPVSIELDCNRFVQDQPKKPDFIEE